MDNLTYENNLKDKYKFIAGCDEAGRGPLAGPVVIASVIMPLNEEDIIEGVNDSKKLTEKKRNELYDKIIEKALAYNIVSVSEKVIDEINILNATKQGMNDAINNLNIKPDYALIDAVKGLNLVCDYLPIIKGDSLSYSIACASILAKVTRDRLMLDYDNIYPNYEFQKHKGYGTKVHIEALKKFGKCEIHRETFIKNFVN